MLFSIVDLGVFHSSKLFSWSIAKKHPYTLLVVYPQAPVDGLSLRVTHCGLHYCGFGPPDGDVTDGEGGCLCQ